VQLHNYWPAQCAREDAVGLSHSLELPRSDVAALEDCPRRKQILQRRKNERLSLLHPQRRNLQHQYILVLVNDEPAEKIAFGVDDADRGCGGQVPLPYHQRCPNSFLEKMLIDLDALRCQQTDIDLRFGIVTSDSEEALSVVFELHQRAVCRGLR